MPKAFFKNNIHLYTNCQSCLFNKESQLTLYIVKDTGTKTGTGEEKTDNISEHNLAKTWQTKNNCAF